MKQLTKIAPIAALDEYHYSPFKHIQHLSSEQEPLYF